MDMQVQADESPIYTLNYIYTGVHITMSKKLWEFARKLPLKPSDWSWLISIYPAAL